MFSGDVLPSFMISLECRAYVSWLSFPMIQLDSLRQIGWRRLWHSKHQILPYNITSFETKKTRRPYLWRWGALLLLYSSLPIYSKYSVYVPLKDDEDCDIYRILSDNDCKLFTIKSSWLSSLAVTHKTDGNLLKMGEKFYFLTLLKYQFNYCPSSILVQPMSTRSRLNQC